jgi:predicted enzyme related to lactoylglutathione lyase
VVPTIRDVPDTVFADAQPPNANDAPRGATLGGVMWNFKGLGWFSRFVTPDLTGLRAFYVQTLGLPLLRTGTLQKVDFLWAGEAIVHQLIYEGRMSSADPADADPLRAPLVPVYRTTALDSLIETLRTRGACVGEPTDGPAGREACIADGSGSLILLRQAPEHSRFLHDQVAAFRCERGEAFNPGCESLPAGLQELGWLVRRVVDVSAMERFYCDTLGLSLIARAYGRALLDLGDNTVLELAGGGCERALPADRSEVSAIFILRVDDIRRFRDGMRERSVRVVHELIEWPRGALTYVADPEGNLIGVEERYHPRRYAPKLAPFPEDLEAQRRWAERCAAGAQPAVVPSRASASAG